MTPKLKSPLLPYSTWNCHWYDEKYDCARDRACISRDNRMVTILANPRQTTLSLSRTRNGPDQRPKVDNRQQRRRAREIWRRIRCNSIRARKDCGMTKTTTTSRRRRRRSYRATTWLVPVHFLFLFSIYIYVSLLKELVLVLRDGKTRAAESNVDRLGQFPFEIDAVPDRVPPHLGLHFLPSARHLNLPLLALSRDIGMAIRYDDIQHDRTHTFTFTFMYIYYVQYIRTLHFLVLNIYMRYYLIINIYYFTFNVAFAKRTLSPNGLSPNHLQFLSFIKIKCACCEVWLYNIQLFLIIFVYWRIQDGLEVNSLVAWDTWKHISFSRSRSRNIFLRNITPSISSSLGSIAISLTNRNLESPSRAPSITLHILLFTEHFRCVAYRYMYVRPYLIFFLSREILKMISIFCFALDQSNIEYCLMV